MVIVIHIDHMNKTFCLLPSPLIVQQFWNNLVEYVLESGGLDPIPPLDMPLDRSIVFERDSSRCTGAALLKQEIVMKICCLLLLCKLLMFIAAIAVKVLMS